MSNKIQTSFYNYKSIYKLQSAFIPLILGLFLLTTGCATTDLYTPVNYCNEPINAKMARLILKREWQLMGGGRKFRVYDNDQPIADLKNGDTVCWDRYPGTAIVTVGSAQGERYPGANLEAEVKANNTYNVQVGRRMSGKIYFELTDKPK